MPENNSVLQYQKQAVSTMSKGELLLKLFDVALKNIKYASILLKEKDYEKAEIYINKSSRIFNHLCLILDRKYSISLELYQIYRFLNQEIIRANINRDAEILDKILPLVQELHDTWAEADKLSHMQK
ncbi:MAG: flagellar export chaperone FliS [Clostridia bacterium]|nr:flagellar export chaperone FliS [Clostridia bacterium]